MGTQHSESILTEDNVNLIVEELRAKARRNHAARVPLDSVDDAHRQTFVRAINNVLSTELAIFTYAQIIDGLPIADVAWDRRLPNLHGDHPLDDHEHLCPGSLEKAQKMCRSWNPDILLFNPKLVADYQKAPPGSKSFETRLIELVAVTLHQFAALLFQLDFRLHQGDIESVIRWTPTIPPGAPMVYVPPRSTPFSHHAYLDHDMYPEGVADVVGYWAEDRILGGVVVFDRKAEERGNADSAASIPTAPKNVYIHPCRDYVTFRVCQLRDDQQRALVDFLVHDGDSDGETTASPLPVLPDKKNKVRVDAWVAIIYHCIHRDVWERRPPTRDHIAFWERRPKSECDYPEAMNLMVRMNRMIGIPIPEKLQRRLEEEEKEEKEEKERKERNKEQGG